jgi:hypothetical protein
MSSQVEFNDNQSLDTVVASSLDAVVDLANQMTDEIPMPSVGVPAAMDVSGLETKEDTEDVLSKPLQIVFNATPETPDGIFSIFMDKRKILQNWSQSMIAQSLAAENALPRLDLKMDPQWLTDDGQYAVKRIFNSYINLNDSLVPEPEWIQDGSQIEEEKNCGTKDHYVFAMSFGSEPICDNVLSKYPQYQFAPNEEDEIGGLVPGSWNFWYSLKEADAEYDQKISATFEREFEEKFANFPQYPNFVEDFKRRIIPAGKSFVETFDTNEFEAVMGMIQLYGVNLLKDAASIGEYLGLNGLVRLACMVIGEQIRYWPEVEKCIEDVYEQRINDLRKQFEEEKKAKEAAAASASSDTAAGAGAAAAATVPVSDDDDDDDDDDAEVD